MIRAADFRQSQTMCHGQYDLGDQVAGATGHDRRSYDLVLAVLIAPLYSWNVTFARGLTASR